MTTQPQALTGRSVPLNACAAEEATDAMARAAR